MGRIYTVSFAGTITAAGGDTDLLEVSPSSDKPVKLRGMLLSQISEVADAEEEGLRISVIRLPATVTSGSGGSAATPRSPDDANAAAGFSAEVNNTTVATTGGTAETLIELGWNNRNSPYEWWAPEAGYAPKAKSGQALVVRLQTTLGDDMTGVFTFWLEEE